MANGEDNIQTPSDVLTKLSTALMQISRGDPIVALRAELRTTFEGINTRFEAIDKATELQHEDMVRVPTQVDKAIQGLRDLLEQSQTTSHAEIVGELHTAVEKLRGDLHTYVAETREKFSGVTSQFNQNEKALSAAFQAQEKQATATNDSNRAASTKMENGFNDLIKAITETFNTKASNLEASINEIKGSIISLQSRAGTTIDVRRDSRDDQRNTLSVISVVISLAALSTIIVIELIKR